METHSRTELIVTGALLLAITILPLIIYLMPYAPYQLLWIGGLFLFAVCSELLFKRNRCSFRKPE